MHKLTVRIRVRTISVSGIEPILAISVLNRY